MKRYTTFTIPFSTGNFCTVQTAGGHDLDTKSALTHCVLHGTLHSAAEHNTFFELLSDAVGDELSIEVRTADLFDIDVDGNAHQFLEFGLQNFNVFTFLTDHNARTSGENCDASVLSGTLDKNTTYRGVLELFAQVIANFEVFSQCAGKIAASSIPTGSPVVCYGKAKACRINFLSHGSPIISSPGYHRPSRRCGKSVYRYGHRGLLLLQRNDGESWLSQHR